MVPTRSIGRAIRKRIQKSAESAQNAVQQAKESAKQTAKQQLDQVLLGLQHKGLSVRDSQDKMQDMQDMIQRLGRGVLERAETIRSQIASAPLAPAWLRQLSLGGGSGAAGGDRIGKLQSGAPLAPADATSLTEATVSQPAEDMQPWPIQMGTHDRAVDDLSSSLSSSLSALTPAPAGEFEEDILTAVEEAAATEVVKPKARSGRKQTAPRRATVAKRNAADRKKGPAMSARRPKTSAAGAAAAGTGASRVNNRNRKSVTKSASSSSSASASAPRRGGKRRSRSAEAEI